MKEPSTTSIRQRDEFAITAVSTLVQRLPETLRAQWVSIVVALTSRGAGQRRCGDTGHL